MGYDGEVHHFTLLKGGKMSDERKELLKQLEKVFTECVHNSNPDCSVYNCEEKCEKAYEQIRQLIQQKPEIDKEYVDGRAVEIYNLSYYKSFKPEEIGEIITQIISDVKGGK
jgi:hypothetical protein